MKKAGQGTGPVASKPSYPVPLLAAGALQRMTESKTPRQLPPLQPPASPPPKYEENAGPPSYTSATKKSREELVLKPKPSRSPPPCYVTACKDPLNDDATSFSPPLNGRHTGRTGRGERQKEEERHYRPPSAPLPVPFPQKPLKKLPSPPEKRSTSTGQAVSPEGGKKPVRASEIPSLKPLTASESTRNGEEENKKDKPPPPADELIISPRMHVVHSARALRQAQKEDTGITSSGHNDEEKREEREREMKRDRTRKDLSRDERGAKKAGEGGDRGRMDEKREEERAKASHPAESKVVGGMKSVKSFLGGETIQSLAMKHQVRKLKSVGSVLQAARDEEETLVNLSRKPPTALSSYSSELKGEKSREREKDGAKDDGAGSRGLRSLPQPAQRTRPALQLLIDVPPIHEAAREDQETPISHPKRGEKDRESLHIATANQATVSAEEPFFKSTSPIFQQERGPRQPSAGLQINLSDITEQEVAMQQSYKLSASGTFNVADFQIKKSGITKSPEKSTIEPVNIQGNIVKLCMLGKGASGVVHKALHLPTFRLVAVKVIPVFESEKRHQMVKELRALYSNMVPLSEGVRSRSPCPFVVSFYDAFINPNEGNISIVVEYMDGGSLQDIVDSGGCASESVLANISRRILKGLAFIHEKHQVHRDIKPGNLLIDHKGHVKVSDFGIVRDLENSMAKANTFVGTLTYMSPERIAGEPPELPTDKFSPEFCDFVTQCLHKDKDKRASAKQLLQHPFLLAHPPLSDIDEDEPWTEHDDPETAMAELAEVLQSLSKHCLTAVEAQRKGGHDPLLPLRELSANLPAKVDSLSYQIGIKREIIQENLQQMFVRLTAEVQALCG